MTELDAANRRLPPGLRFTHPAALVATWFGSGLLPWAPGTWGSLFALPLAVLIHTLAGGLGLALAAVVAFLLGWAASNIYLKALRTAEIKDDDPRAIVIDEVAGQWLTLAVVPFDTVLYGIGFLLFRFFDVVKPWPAGMIDRRIKGGFGIMLDDIAAAIYAAGCLFLVNVVIDGG